MATDVLLTLGSKAGRRRVRLSQYLSGEAGEDAARQANAWIKSLRHARIDGLTFRERFTYRDDSLWWFAELFLHKERAILSLFRTIAAMTNLLDREAPHSVQIDDADGALRLVVTELTRARGIFIDSPAVREASAFHVLKLDARCTALMIAAVAARGRPGRVRPAARVPVAAFVHRAFWKGSADDGSAESYIGPVLQALERRLPSAGIRYVGLGPFDISASVPRRTSAPAGGGGARRRPPRPSGRSKSSRRGRHSRARRGSGPPGTRCGAPCCRARTCAARRSFAALTAGR
jgi:hypothetical protein